MDQDFPLPVCPYAKIVPLKPSNACDTIGIPDSSGTKRRIKRRMIGIIRLRNYKQNRSAIFTDC